MIRNLVIAIGLSVTLVGCASQTAATSAEADVATAKVVPGLSSQQLVSGECGLFMWTFATPRKLVFFSKASSGSAAVNIQDKDMAFSQTAAAGDIFGQFMTETEYRSIQGTESLKLTLVPGDALEDGQRTKEASLIYTDAKGWDTIIPVRGVTACAAG